MAPRLKVIVFTDRVGSSAAATDIGDFPNARRWLIDHDVLGDDNPFLVPTMERWIREQVVNAKRTFDSRS